MKRNFTLLLIFIFFCNGFIDAQNFNYNFSSTTELYAPLDSTQTHEFFWTESYSNIPIGYSFTFAGHTYDSLTIRSNSLLSFDTENKYNFVFFNKELLPDFDTENHLLSQINSYLENTFNNQKILKIEFKNVIVSVSDSLKIHCSFQIWLKQYSNSIEIHMGSVDDPGITATYLIGLINMNNTSTADVGYLLHGNVSSPSPIRVLMGGAPVMVSGIPSSGTVYTFSPQLN